MIEVERLTKYYGTNIGVNNLNFRVEKGEVLGFLGPNGAGKTTTMKMLTCYLPPTAGTARVFGHDILENSMEVRRLIGYLPERNPLYGDMSVRGYLEFVADLKGVPMVSRRTEVNRTIERCGLEAVPHRTISKLSKGYQQRVGIAQAILNDPALLVLDEPTLGLDPKQIIEIRQLIRGLGGEKTVILSSHILPEVSQVCSRVIIINRGELVAVDTPDNLRARLATSSRLKVKIRDAGPSERAAALVAAIDGVLAVKDDVDDGVRTLEVECASDRDAREEIIRVLVAERVPLLELRGEELSLEDIFLQLVTEEVD